MPLTLSTDDAGIFDTDIANECVVAIQNFDLQYSELKSISYTSVTASFMDDDKKIALLEDLDNEFQAFETQYTAKSGKSKRRRGPKRPGVRQLRESQALKSCSVLKSYTLFNFTFSL